jgi:hypothetical protein
MWKHAGFIWRGREIHQGAIHIEKERQSRPRWRSKHGRHVI